VNDLRLQIKLNSHRARNPDLAAGTEHMSIAGMTPMNESPLRRRAGDQRPG
jgi:hypothetical protein